jgi:hypothetical protein
MRIQLATLGMLVLGLAGCAAEDDAGDDGQATTVSTTVAMTTVGGSESDDTSDPSTTVSMTTAPAESSDDGAQESSGAVTTDEPGTDEGSSGPSDESSTGAAGSACDPAVEDDDCNACTKMKCCPQLETCFADPICECMSGCVTGLGDVDPCTEMCGSSPNFQMVTDCAGGMCLFECIG